MKTYLVFCDLPVHVEYKVSESLPIVPEGIAISFKGLNLSHPRDPKRLRHIDGNYKVSRVRLIYSSEGLSQYLELDPHTEEL